MKEEGEARRGKDPPGDCHCRGGVSREGIVNKAKIGGKDPLTKKKRKKTKRANHNWKCVHSKKKREGQTYKRNEISKGGKEKKGHQESKNLVVQLSVGKMTMPGKALLKIRGGLKKLGHESNYGQGGGGGIEKVLFIRVGVKKRWGHRKGKNHKKK